MSCYLWIYNCGNPAALKCCEFEVSDHDPDDMSATDIYTECIERNPGLVGAWFEVEVDESYDLLFKQTADRIVDVYRHADCVFLPEEAA